MSRPEDRRRRAARSCHVARCRRCLLRRSGDLIVQCAPKTKPDVTAINYVNATPTQMPPLQSQQLRARARSIDQLIQFFRENAGTASLPIVPMAPRAFHNLSLCECRAASADTLRQWQIGRGPKDTEERFRRNHRKEELRWGQFNCAPKNRCAKSFFIPFSLASAFLGPIT